MGSLLAEPFLLASYPLSSQISLQAENFEHPERSRHVKATCSSNGRGEGFVTMSVQGDGVHVLEFSSTHATVSHTLGPSACFAAPAVTRFDRSDANTSYGVMESAPDGIKDNERGRTVWRWRDYQSRRPEEPVELKLSATFPRRISHIWAPTDLPLHVIAVSPSGEVMLADGDLHVISINAPLDAGGVLHRSWIFGPAECDFLPHSKDQPDGVIVMCYILISKRLKLRIILAQSTGELKEITECDLGTQENIIDISCDTSGYVSVLDQRGDWQFFRLGHDAVGRVSARSLSVPLRLTALLFPSSNDGGNSTLSGPSLLSVGSSHVLLAGIAGESSPGIVLLLWDLQYSVVLASQSLALPSAMAYTPKSPPSLELVPASGTQALLVLSPSIRSGTQRSTNAAQSRSTVLVVSLGVPPVSTIALAMGKARDTQRWLQSTHSPNRDAGHGQGRDQMMQSVREALEQGRVQAAETAFFAWVDDEATCPEALQGQAPPPDREDNEMEKGSDDGADAYAPIAKGGEKMPKRPVLSHQLVSRILDTVLQPSKTFKPAYSSKIVLYLLQRAAVGHAMVEGGLVPVLALRKDWESVNSALRNVPDIPETALVKLLAETIRAHRQRLISQDDSMQVDALTDVLSLTQFLAMFVAYATSPPALRVALRQHLTDTRDILCVLEVLEGWVARWRRKSWGLTSGLGEASTNSSQAPRPAKRRARLSKPDGMPSFEQILRFLQSVMDTHFVALLQYPPSHCVMDRLAQHLKDELASVDELDRLRGPLESFARAELKKARSGRTKKEGDVEWRKRRKEAGAAAELAIALYQIEELVI